MSINKATKGILGGAGEINIVNRFNLPLFLSLTNKKPILILSIPRKKILKISWHKGG